MGLSLVFPDKYQLWDELLRANVDRLFIESNAPPKLGERVSVELRVDALSLTATAEVLGLRGAGNRFKAGVWVRFDDEEVEKVRRFWGLAQHPSRIIVGRRTPRVRCEIPVVFQRPQWEGEAVARNLSQTGALVESSTSLPEGPWVEFDLMLSSGPVRLSAEMTREGLSARVAGLRFMEASSEVSGLIAQELDRLASVANKAPRKTVLVADDDAAILEFLSKALSKFGYEVIKANDGNEALTLVRELRPHLVILDILMPGIDGVDVCKVMRADVEFAAIPVVFLSSLEEHRLNAVADGSGATDYLSKPTTLTDLLNLVGHYLKS